MSGTRLFATLTVVAFASVACTSSDEPAAPSIPTPTPVDTDPAVTVAPTAQPDDTEPASSGSVPIDTVPSNAVSSTQAVPTTDATTTTTAATTTPDRVRRLPEQLGPLVEVEFDDLPDALEQPGEFVEVFDNTLVYIPDTTDIDNLNNQRPPDEDLAIIAAYAEARGALASQGSQFPVAIEPNERVQAAFIDRGQAYSEGAFLARNQEGTYVGHPSGRPTIYRPYVLSSPRTQDTAVVFDCKFVSGQVLFEDGTPVRESSGTFNRSGSQATLTKVDGKWLVDEIILQEAACAG